MSLSTAVRHSNPSTHYRTHTMLGHTHRSQCHKATGTDSRYLRSPRETPTGRALFKVRVWRLIIRQFREHLVLVVYDEILFRWVGITHRGDCAVSAAVARSVLYRLVWFILEGLGMIDGRPWMLGTAVLLRTVTLVRTNSIQFIPTRIHIILLFHSALTVRTSFVLSTCVLSTVLC